MSHAYSITLHHPALSPIQCQEAEVQYRQVLERALGGTERVLQAWQAWQEAEHKLGGLSEETWKVARQWLIAAERARQLTLQGPTNISDAYFEVQSV